jgi:predicted acyl esterase
VQARDDAPAKQTVMVPMRDGVKLATDIYLPKGSAVTERQSCCPPHRKSS